MMDFLQAYLLSLAVEAPLFILFLRDEHRWDALALSAVIATSLTLPFVWFFFPALGLAWPAQTAMSELFAFSLEAAAYRLISPKLAWRDALTASALCNGASFLLGLAF